MPEQNLLIRTIKYDDYGQDVDGLKRTVYRALDQANGTKKLGEYNTKTIGVKRKFGTFFTPDLNKVLVLLGEKPNSVCTPAMLTRMAKKGWPDANAIELFNQYRDLHRPAPPAPRYTEPLQGFGSLVRDLYPLYTKARSMGLSDLGTYNSGSVLPSSGKPSDHATSRLSSTLGEPACAFDAGFSPATGYDNAKAREFFHLCVNDPNVHYVICGNKIWSEERGLHSYTSGGHENHVHVSGHRR